MQPITTALALTTISLAYILVVLFIVEKLSMSASIIKIGEANTRKLIRFQPDSTDACQNSLERAIRDTPYCYNRHFKMKFTSRRERKELMSKIREVPFEISHKSSQMSKNHTNIKGEGLWVYFQMLFTLFLEKSSDEWLKRLYTRYQQEIIETAVLNMLALCFDMTKAPDSALHSFNRSTFEACIQASKTCQEGKMFFPITSLKSIHMAGVDISRLPMSALQFFDRAVGLESLMMVHVSVRSGLNFHFRLRNLKRLKLHHTALTDIPSLMELRDIESLDLRSNRITNIKLGQYDVDSKDFRPLARVKYIDLRFNPVVNGDVEKIFRVFPGLQVMLLDGDGAKVKLFKMCLSRRYGGRLEYGMDANENC